MRLATEQALPAATAAGGEGIRAGANGAQGAPQPRPPTAGRGQLAWAVPPGSPMGTVMPCRPR